MSTPAAAVEAVDVFDALTESFGQPDTPCAWRRDSDPEDVSAADHGPARWLLSLEKHRRDRHVGGFDEAPACDRCVQYVIAHSHSVSYPRSCPVCGHFSAHPSDRYRVRPL